MTFDDYLKEVRARLEAATPGPWFEVDGERVQVDLNGLSEDADGLVADAFDPTQPEGGYQTSQTRSNALFIANAPTDIARLLKAVEVLREGLRNISQLEILPPYEFVIERCEEIANEALAELDGILGESK